MTDAEKSGLDRKLLGIYLNDHLAGSSVGVELARRIHSQNKGNRFGELLERLAREIEEDRRTLEELMDRLEIRKDTIKTTAGWLGEKVGRLKLNGRLLGYSPLSRLVELEGLTLGVAGKAGLWKALKTVADLDRVLDATDLDGLADRAGEQLTALEQARLEAAELALTGSDEADGPPVPYEPMTAGRAG